MLVKLLRIALSRLCQICLTSIKKRKPVRKMKIVTKTYIYFIYSKRFNAVKIGLSRNVPARLNAIRLGIPDAVLIGKIRGNYKAESYYHRLFQAHTLSFKPSQFPNGKVPDMIGKFEWFKYEGVSKEIAKLLQSNK